MKYWADLHMHSTASDGQYTPSELVGFVHQKGLDVMSLTDHDSIDGLAEAMAEGNKRGITVVPGIELSAREYPTFHILGYGFSVEKAIEEGTFDEALAYRIARTDRIVSYLHEKDIEIDLDEVRKVANGVIGRPHFARVMLDKGYVKNDREAFDRFLDTEEYHDYIGAKGLAVEECISRVKSLGGIVSLAHPYQIGIVGEELDKLVKMLVEYGLDAIECYYPKYSREQSAYYLGLVDKYGLHMTGGSDFHGEKVKPDISIEGVELELDWLIK